MAITMKMMDLIDIYCQDMPEPSESWTDKIDYGATKLFNFNFPFFDESKRKDFEEQFIMHFYTRCLGFETPALFQFKLCEALNLLMPYYNELYNSTLLEYEPFYNILMEETYKQEGSTELEATGDIADTLSKTFDKTLTETKKETTEKTGTDITNVDNTTENTKTGTDSTTVNDTTTDKKTGTDTISKTGTDTDTKTGTESRSKTGTEKEESTENQSHTGSVTTDNTTDNKFSELPQAMMSNEDYLTDMRVIDENGTTTNDLTDNISIDKTKTYNLQEPLEYDISTKTLHDTTDETTYNTTDTITKNGSSETTYNTTNTISDTGKNTITYDTNVTTDTTGNSTDNSTEETTGNKNITNNSMEKRLEDYTKTNKGMNGKYSYQELLMMLRETYINVTQMIFNDMYIRSLFIYVG